MIEKNYPQTQACVGGAVEARRLDITLRQNIDEQIAQAKARVKSLEETKDRLSTFGILDMRIDDMQQAMRW